nr:MAG TPA: hypothetical protein [Caudoviricetes sp.]
MFYTACLTVIFALYGVFIQKMSLYAFLSLKSLVGLVSALYGYIHVV